MGDVARASNAATKRKRVLEGKKWEFFFPLRVSVGSILDLSSTGKEEMDLRGTVGSD